MAFLMAWSRLYRGDPAEILTDSVSCFTSDLFKQACANNEITLRHTNTESHNSLGEGEICHKTIRKKIPKLRMDFPTVPKSCYNSRSMSPTYSVNAHGLNSMLLVFGMVPKIPSVNGTRAISQDEWLRLLLSAWEEYAQNIPKKRTELSLKENTSSVSEDVFQGGDKVFI